MASPAIPFLCRTLGCRWRYRASGRILHGECARRCGATGAQSFRDADDAARLASYLRSSDGPTGERLLSPLAKVVDACTGGASRRRGPARQG